MAAIKQFFKKKKAQMKFALMKDEGHRLNEESSGRGAPRQYASSSYQHPQHFTDDSRRAGAAAIARLSQPKPGASKGAAANLQAAMAAEIHRAGEVSAAPRPPGATAAAPQKPAKNLSVQGVYYKCSLIGPECLSFKETLAKIEHFLDEQLLGDQPAMSAALIIQSLNKDTNAIKICIETLCKYLQNIVDNPGVDKFRKIRMSNKAFQERVASQKGGLEFLRGAGFVEHNLPGPGENAAPEPFLVIDEQRLAEQNKADGESKSESEILSEHIETLLAAEPILPELDRNTRVFKVADNSFKRFNLPDEFYAISSEELKKEQQIRTEAVEQMGMLMTKAMKERAAQRQLRRYRYTLIRVRFPNNLILQGTFGAQDKLSLLFQFVSESLVEEWLPYYLVDPLGKRLENDDSSFVELGLAPAAILNFCLDPESLRDIEAASPDILKHYLKNDLLARVSRLSVSS